MSRAKKDFRPFNIKLEKTLYDRLDAFCKETHRGRTDAAEMIFERFLDEYENFKSIKTKD